MARIIAPTANTTSNQKITRAISVPHVRLVRRSRLRHIRQQSVVPPPTPQSKVQLVPATTRRNHKRSRRPPLSVPVRHGLPPARTTLRSLSTPPPTPASHYFFLERFGDGNAFPPRLTIFDDGVLRPPSLSAVTFPTLLIPDLLIFGRLGCLGIHVPPLFLVRQIMPQHSRTVRLNLYQ